MDVVDDDVGVCFVLVGANLTDADALFRRSWGSEVGPAKDAGAGLECAVVG
jgi:hypothetical protein